MGFQSKQVSNFLGNGITLPLRLVNGAVPLDTGVELIRASIRMILLWELGTRFFLPEFGSRIEDLIEEPNDDVLTQLVYTVVVDALLTWEKRIEVLDVETDRDDFGSLKLRVFYRIITSQKTDTFTFPFYNSINT